MGFEVSARAQQLEDAFAAFNQLSVRLESSYRDLENRVEQLKKELEQARNARIQQLSEKERIANRLKHLLELMPGGLIVLDGNGCVAECNPAAEQIFELPLLHSAWHEVIATSVLPQKQNQAEVLLRNGKRISISTRPLDTEPGQILLIMDVTKQYALQQMLQRHERLSAMGEMAATLAHQVRTPLATAILYLSHFSNENLAPIQYARISNKIKTRLLHLERMVADMLQFTRGGSYSMQYLTVTELLEEIEINVESIRSEGSVTIQMVNGCGSKAIIGNKEVLTGAIMNLVNNAVQACDDSCHIIIETFVKNGRFLSFIVKDNGPGIDEDIQSKLFTPFFTTKTDGTGLGLAVVRSVVAAHGGSIRLTSKLGEGSCFELSFSEAPVQEKIA